jgi:hypothetical protein
MLYEEKVSPEFATKVATICAGLGFNPDWLMAGIGFETAHTFSPSIKNPKSGAVGLIQFMPSVASELGASMQALEAMDAVTQLDWVEKYFQMQAKRGYPVNTISDVYLNIFYPVATKWSLDRAFPQKVADANQIFVNPTTHKLTKRQIEAVIYASLPKDYRPFLMPSTRPATK